MDWAYLMLSVMKPQAAASAFLMSFPEIVELETGEIAEKPSAKARIVERFYNLISQPGRKASREIRKNRKLKDRIEAFDETYDTPLLKFEALIYYAQLLEMAEEAESNSERFRYLREAWRVCSGYERMQDLSLEDYDLGNFDVSGGDK